MAVAGSRADDVDYNGEHRYSFCVPKALIHNIQNSARQLLEGMGLCC